MTTLQYEGPLASFSLKEFLRTSVGFDPQLKSWERMFSEDNASYPPYNIVQEGADKYKVTLAIAGFGEKDLSIITKDNVLQVSGEKNETADEGIVFLHKGIASRKFVKKIQMDKHVEVEKASIKDGLLTVSFVRNIPESARSKKIPIQS